MAILLNQNSRIFRVKMASTNRKPSRYKEVCKEVFSADYNSDEIQQHNLKKLIFYASTNPDKLDAMGAYLLAKLGRNLTDLGIAILPQEVM